MLWRNRSRSLIVCWHNMSCDNCCRWSDDENGDCEEIDGLGAMELAMETWADWVTTKLNPHKKVLFVTMSPTHLWCVVIFSNATHLHDVLYGSMNINSFRHSETNFRNCTSTSLSLSSLMCGKHQQRIVTIAVVLLKILVNFSKYCAQFNFASSMNVFF